MNKIEALATKARKYLNQAIRMPYCIRKSLERSLRKSVAPDTQKPDLQLYPGYSAEDLSVFDPFPPVQGKSHPGFIVDFLGIRTRTSFAGAFSEMDGKVLGIPVPIEDSFHAETIEWIGLLKSVLTARDQYVALELGAGWAPWLIAGATAAKRVGTKNVKLYGVEGDPAHFAFMQDHFRDNGFDPDEYCLFNAAVGVNAGRARFPKLEDPAGDWGARPLGAAEACETMSTLSGEPDYRGVVYESYIEVDILPISSLLEREAVWDLVHIDVQGWEVELCKASADLLDQRVRWLVIGTHSRKIEGDLVDLLFRRGWLLENEKPAKFTFAPSAPSLEAMAQVDGTQVWKNPRLGPSSTDSVHSDSRQREGLRAELHVKLESDRVAAGKPLRLEAVVKNTGSTVWRPTTAPVGAVHFGMHLFDQRGALLDLDYFRFNLTPGEGREILPGETVKFAAELPMPSAGKYMLQCDLVSEAVCWFEHNGSPTVKLKVEVA